MWGKLTKDARLGWYPTIGIVLTTIVGLTATWVLAGRFLAKVPAPPISSAQELIGTEHKVATVSESPLATASTATPPKPEVQVQHDRSVSEASAEKSNGGAIATAGQGTLRISNPTDYPVRVALLSKKTVTAGTQPKPKNTYDTPAHWDFAPQEGGAKGLIVSLPDRTLKIKKGDILVAFAQDGSGRYWGPYVVGETALPTWSTQAREWQLTLQ